MLQFGGMMIEEKDSTGRYKSIINLNKKDLRFYLTY